MAEMQFDISARDSASKEFLALAAAAERLEERLKSLDRMQVDPKIKLDTRAASTELKEFEARLKALKDVRVNIRADVDAAELKGFAAQLRALRDARVDVKANVDTAKAIAQIKAFKAKAQAEIDALKARTAIKIDADTSKAAAQIDVLKARAENIHARTIKIDIDTSKAQAQIEVLKARAESIHARTIKINADTARALAQVEMLKVRIESMRAQAIKIQLDTGSFLGQLARVQATMKSIAGGRVQIDAETRTAMERLAELRTRVVELGLMKPDVTVKADTAKARAEILALEMQLAQIAGKQYRAEVKVDVDRRGRMAQWQAILAGIAAFAPTIAAGVGSMTASLVTLVGSVAGTAPILVASLGMVGGVLATIEVGTQGVGAALTAMAQGDAKNFEQAMKTLTPEAQGFVLALKDMYTALKVGQGAVQGNLFRNLGTELRRLGQAEIPMLVTGMGRVATELNGAAVSVLRYVASSEGIARQSVMWSNTRAVVANLSPVLTNVVASLFDVGEVGSRVLADITTGAGAASAQFRAFIAQARESGRLEQWMREGARSIALLGSTAANLGSVFASVWRAADAAGSDFLALLERNTAAMAHFMASASAQSSLTTFFRESRVAMDLLATGLGNLGQGFMQMLGIWANTGSMVAFTGALSQILTVVGALLPKLGELAGNSMVAFANGMSLLAQTVGPVIGLLLSLANATGPIAPMIIGMVAAFRLLTPVGAWVTGIGTAVANAATQWGVWTLAATNSARAGQVVETTMTRVGGALSRIGSAVPILGVVLVGVAAAYELLASKADDAAQRVVAGANTMKQAIASETVHVQNQTMAMNALNAAAAAAAGGEMGLPEAINAEAIARDNVTKSIQQQLSEMTSYAQLQAIVKMAETEYNDAVIEGGAASPKAAAAAAALAAAKARLAEVDREAAAASRDHAAALRDDVAAAQTALGTMLALEGALARLGESEKAANAAVRAHGASSQEGAAALRQYVTDADAAAQAAQRNVTATQGAEAGTRAYGAALLQVAANASGPARTALLEHLSNLSQVELDALSAGVATSGFATKILTLPNGKTVKIAVDPETGKIVTTQQMLDRLSATQVMIKVGAETMPARDALQQVLTAVQQGQAEVTINGKTQPALDGLAEVGRLAGLTNATVEINGQTVNAQTVLDGFIASVKSHSPTVNINGQDVDARTVFAALMGTIVSANPKVPIGGDPAQFMTALNDALTAAGSKTGIISLDGNPTLVDGKISQAVTFANGSKGTVVIDGHPDPATGKVDAVVTYANGSKATVTLNPNDLVTPVLDQLTVPRDSLVTAVPAVGAAVAALDNTALPRDSTVTAVPQTGDAEGQLNNTARPRPSTVTAIPQTSSANSAIDYAARDRTSTIRVTVAYGYTPRAEGGYATPMAAGGVLRPVDRMSAPVGLAEGAMRSMSAGYAEIVPPNQPRVIGDRMRGDEAFIPIERTSRRSQAILEVAAARMGRTMLPMSGPSSDGSPMRGPAALRTTQDIRVNHSGAGADVVAAIQQLRADLRSQYAPPGAGTGPIVEGLARVEAAVSRAIGGGGSAAGVAQAGRVSAALGAW